MALDPDGDYIVGAVLREVVESSTEYACVECGRDAWFAPSGQQILRERPTFKPLCIVCALRNGMTIAQPPTPQQRSELYEHGHDPDRLMDELEERGILQFDRPGTGYQPEDPKHPDFHDTFSDIWDQREGK